MRYLLPAVLLVVSGSVVAQVPGPPLVCSANSSVPPVIRADGYAELAGDIVNICTGGNPAVPVTINLQLFLNTNITSRLIASDPSMSEALLMIDEPGWERSNSAGTPRVATPFCLSPGIASNSISSGVACNPTRPGETYQQGTYTVFRAARGDGENDLVWSGIPLVPPGPGMTRVLRITNLRVNATSLGSSATLIPTQVIAFLSSSPTGSLPIDKPQQTVGYVQQSLMFDVRSCKGELASAASVMYGQCSPSEAQRQFFDTPKRPGTLPATGAFRFREAFQTAFKRRILSEQSDSLPGVVYNTESGFVRSESGVSGIADTAARLAVRFTNVPAGVRIFVSAREASGSTTDTKAVLVTADKNGAPSLGSPSASRPDPAAPESPGLLGCDGNTVGAVEIAISAGTGLAVWEVTDSKPYQSETLLFTYGIAYRYNPADALPTVGSGVVSGSFAPSYSLSDTSSRMQGLQVAVPRFAMSMHSSEFMRISACGASTGEVEFTSNVADAQILVDDVAYTMPTRFAWSTGETHTIDVVPVQTISPSARRRFAGWSNGGAQRKTITVPSSPVTIGADFRMQYAVKVSSTAGGSVGLSPASSDGFYDSGTEIQISAAPLNGFKLDEWVDSLTGQPHSGLQFQVAEPVGLLARFAPVSCVAVVTPSILHVPATEHVTLVQVLHSRSCGGWSAVSDKTWLKTRSASGSGTREEYFDVDANPSAAPRTAHLTIAGQVVTVTQAGHCAITLNSTPLQAPASGSSGQRDFISACSWTVWSSYPWIQPFPLSGTGSGTLSYTVFPNFSGSLRGGSITIGDKTFWITQAAGTGSAESRFIRLLYFNYFGRLPADAEIAFQLGSGQSRPQLAYNFLNSPEFNNAGRFVAGLYIGLLNRDAEYGGWLFQRNALSRGITKPDTLVANFLNSEEFKLKYENLSNAAFTTLLYTQILGRAPTPAEVLWREGLLTGGMTRAAMARDLLSSTEFRIGNNARLTAFLLYATLLNRGASPAEFQQRRDQIAVNPSEAMVRSILTEIVQSAELQNQIQ